MRNHHLSFQSNPTSRTLILSKRAIYNHVCRCGGYEFEDVIYKSDAVDMFVPPNSYESAQHIFGLIKRYTRSGKIANILKPDPNPIVLNQSYDLFFVVCTSPWDILAISSIKNWRQRCKKAICYIEEIWKKDIPMWKPVLELLQDFDHVFTAFNDSVAEIAEIVQRPCSYLPPGIDAIEFSPYPKQLPRSIDVFNMGRRSETTHKALLELAESQQLFYYYDTPKNFNVINPQEHRKLLGDMLKRSRYFFVNRAKADQKEQICDQQEIGYRFFEGAAAGAILLGEPLETAAFKHYFDWEDAVVRVPFDCPNIADVLAELDAQPDRIHEIRRRNVVNSLQRHDWVHRWAAVLQQAGLQPNAAMRTRLARLSELAEMAGLDRLPPKAQTATAPALN